MKKSLILVTGANGYVGSRLVKKLVQGKASVRCMVRNLRFYDTSLIPEAEFIEGDALNEQSLNVALDSVEIAYYLIHSMGSNQEFTALDRLAAENFARAASRQGVRRIIYLGGLGQRSLSLSKHLQSRQEVGEILRSSSCEVIELRASIVIGPGSLSFELIRSLVERLPIMITPRWVRVKTQPIFIEDVISFLVEAQNISCAKNIIFEIGGPEKLSYGELMQRYAHLRGLKRLMISVPFLSKRLSSLWLALVTPLYARVGRKLIDSLSNQTVVENPGANSIFAIKLTPINQALENALAEEENDYSSVQWYNVDSLVSREKLYPNIFSYGRRLFHSEQKETLADPKILFEILTSIGGKNGFYFGNFLWNLRAIIDAMIGGVGQRRGRKHAARLHKGDTINFWRVEELIPNKLLRLYAEMRVPGQAWLQFEIVQNAEKTHLCQTAIFDPKGLLGLMYWYLLYPLHLVIFKGMIRAIIKRAEMKINISKN